MSQATAKLKHLPFEDIDFAKVDHHRALRQGLRRSGVREGKNPGAGGGNRASDGAAQRVAAKYFGDAVGREDVCGSEASEARGAKFYPDSGVITIERSKEITGKGMILIVSAGTSDIPVAEEALLTARMMGNRVEHLYDVGVAGIHRLLEHRGMLTEARVIICIAGMEGALPSVVGGLVGVPVIAVPTSTGYGASFGGVAALLGMLNSCASNVTVVNIDNGFGAACVASCINRL